MKEQYNNVVKDTMSLSSGFCKEGRKSLFLLNQIVTVINNHFINICKQLF